ITWTTTLADAQQQSAAVSKFLNGAVLIGDSTHDARTPTGHVYAVVFNAARQRPFEHWATKQLSMAIRPYDLRATIRRPRNSHVACTNAIKLNVHRAAFSALGSIKSRGSTGPHL